MLVLSRRIGEKLILGDEIEFQILEISGNQVRIGINAPKSINIVREEIAGRPRREKSADAIAADTTAFPTRHRQQLIGLRRKKRPADLNDNRRHH